jgi:hypothetical protein
VEPALAAGPRLEAATRPVVRRRQAQRVRQLRRSPHPVRTSQQGGPDLRGRARRPPHAHLLGPLRRRQPIRERPQVTRRRERGPRGDLPAAHPRGGHQHARLRADRRHPLGDLRRILARVRARPHQRFAVQGPHHRRRRLSADRTRAARSSHSSATPTRRSRTHPPSSTSSWCSAARVRSAAKPAPR